MNDPQRESMADRHEFQQLLANWCNGILANEEVDRLEELLELSANARKMYLQYATVEAELHAASAGVSRFRDPALFSESIEQSNRDLYERPLPHSQELNASVAARSTALATGSVVKDPALSAGQPSSTSWRWSSYAAIAASLLLVVSIVSQLLQLADSGFAVALKPPRAGNERTLIARVTATRNCRWAKNSAEIGYGAELLEGQRLQLVAGLAEITFEEGSRVLLEGPAELLVRSESDGGALLLNGRLAATVTADGQASRSPVVTTRLGVTLAAASPTVFGLPRATHFGLSASEADGDEVHVFRGAVDAFLRAEGQAEPAGAIHVASREAARIRHASTTVSKFFANQDKFVRSLASTGGPQDGLYAYEGFDYPAGPLSGQNGGFGWAGAWADIEAACPPGEIATNVVEPGSLAYGDLRSIGSHATQRANQNRIRRALSTSLGGVFDAVGLVENQDGLRLVGANGKTIYVGFTQRVDKKDDVFYGFELHRGDGNGNRALCIGNGADGAGYGVTSNYNAYGKSNFGRLGIENQGVNMMVLKIEFGPQNRDLVTVYRNPESLLNERGARVDTQLRGNFAFDRISLGNFDGTKRHEVDEIRIGTTYRAVTGLRNRGSERLLPDVASVKLLLPDNKLANDLFLQKNVLSELPLIGTIGITDR